jgi:AraC-like DNA-binding protein
MQAFVLIFVLLFSKKNHRANLFLALFIASVSAPLVYLLFLGFGLRPVAEIIGILNVPAISVSGVFVYFYVMLVSGNMIRFRMKNHFHFIPFFAVLLYAIVKYAVTDGNPWPNENSIESFIVFAITFFLPTLYILRSFIRLSRYRKAAENWYSDSEKTNFNWLLTITILSLVAFCSYDISYLVIHDKTNIFWRNFLFCYLAFDSIVLIVTLYFIVRQDEIFKDSAQVAELYGSTRVVSEEKISHKYAKQSVSENEIDSYYDSLVTFMNEKKPFLHEDLTIRELSEMVSIPIHHLSIVINSRLNRNFTTFINEYRIAEVRRMLKDEQPDNINILAIAFRCGFNSKSSFNNVFKKITGETPSQYLKGRAV